jgi:hypothetical protein
MGEEMYVVQVEIYFHTVEDAKRAREEDIIGEMFADADVSLKTYDRMMKSFKFHDNCDHFDVRTFKDTFKSIEDDMESHNIESMHAWIWEMDTDEPDIHLES